MKQLRWKTIRARYRYSAILLKELVRADFKVKYQNSVLGYAWSLLRPLFMFIILYFIFVKFLRIGHGIPNWPVALLLGLVMWEFFNEITKTGLRAVVAKGGIIRKINFPKYIIILSGSISALINLALNLVVVAVFVWFSGVSVSWNLLWIPLSIVELYVFALGCAFLLSTLYVTVRDINFVWDIVIRGGFYASGVLFPMTRIFAESEIAGKILLLSPVAQSIQDARFGLLPDSIDSSYTLLGSGLLMALPILIILVVLVTGALYFRKRSPYFAEDI